MGFSEKDLVQNAVPLVGFSGETKQYFGEIVIPTFAEDMNKQREYIAPPQEKLDEVFLDPQFLARTVLVGARCADNIREQIIEFLRTNMDCFAWSHSDMIGIDPSVIIHRLNVDPSFLPIQHKRRKFAPERNEVINQEVDNLLAAGKIMEVNYPEWLSNVMVVPKKNNKWRIKMNPKDQEKTAFRYDRGLYYYNVMPFGLKKVGSTYQRLVNRMFKEKIGRTMEVYIDDMVVKSEKAEQYMSHLENTFSILRKYHMKLNPLKCTFGVSSGKFLGYLVTQRGIEAITEQIKAVLQLESPQKPKDVQSLTG
ncbi:uncharacterized protein LOC141613637 [Silene latifolia]|uniref:uncharacterized protein LOC141613637 n=1 Tax=Silene latifolia TaxID=37657 RepID=UPI003D777E08